MSRRASGVGLVHPDDAPRLAHEAEGYIEQGADTYSQEYRVLTKAGDTRWVRDWNIVVRNADGVATHVQGIVLDVTEQRRLEREILQVSSNERRRLGHDLHDALGQQLTGIGFLSKALERTLSDRSLPGAADAARIVSLASDAVAQARRVAKGLMPVDLAETGLVEALLRLADDTRELFDVECQCLTRGRAPVRDNVVATHLYYITQEAVNNAIRHGKARHITIKLKTHGDEDPRLVIKDDGKGFSLHPGRKRGLGLRIVRFRAEMCGGSVSVLPNGPKGTKVVCRFRNARPKAARPRVSRRKRRSASE